MWTDVVKEMRSAFSGPEWSCFNDLELTERIADRLRDFKKDVPEDEWLPEEARRIREWLPVLEDFLVTLREGLGWEQ